LLPRKLAGEADKGALAQLDAQHRAAQRRESQELAEAQALAARIESAKIAIPAKAGGNGKLFGAVTNADVATAINAVLSIGIDKHKIGLAGGQIKALGTYPVEIKLHKNVVVKTTVDVVLGQ
jgi:large subunit ribosomal protein L9